MRFSRYILLVVFCSAGLAAVMGCTVEIGTGGKVLDEDGKPIPDVTYTMMTSGKPDPRFPEYSHPSGPDGRFSAFMALPNGGLGCNQPKESDFVIRFEKEGYVTKTVPCPDADSRGITVILSKDKKGGKDSSKDAPGAGESTEPKDTRDTRKAR